MVDVNPSEFLSWILVSSGTMDQWYSCITNIYCIHAKKVISNTSYKAKIVILWVNFRILVPCTLSAPHTALMLSEPPWWLQNGSVTNLNNFFVFFSEGTFYSALSWFHLTIPEISCFRNPKRSSACAGGKPYAYINKSKLDGSLMRPVSHFLCHNPLLSLSESCWFNFGHLTAK